MYKVHACTHISLHLHRVIYECADWISITPFTQLNQLNSKEKKSLDSDIKVNVFNIHFKGVESHKSKINYTGFKIK